jgi:DNA-3-methyladenine glycosylase
MSKLLADFYQRDDVLSISRELLGKVLCTYFNGKLTTGIIVETEAYAGVNDCASHAYGGRRTKRTEIMYTPGGTTYVYLCYGIHHLFNIVTNVEGVPHAVLIRAIQPLDGIDIMLKRRNLKKISKKLTAGPGILSQAMGISIQNSGKSLLDKQIWIENKSNQQIDNINIIPSVRVGVRYAGKDALNPWRFQIAGNPWVSKTN